MDIPFDGTLVGIWVWNIEVSQYKWIIFQLWGSGSIIHHGYHVREYAFIRRALGYKAYGVENAAARYPLVPLELAIRSRLRVYKVNERKGLFENYT